MTHEAGKGDKQRPTDYEKFSKNFEAIFGAKTQITEREFNAAGTTFDKAYDEYKKTDRTYDSTPSA